jgi:uncharacterized protein (DUF58 family)
VRLTRSGWLAALGAGCLVVAGRILGLAELFGIGASIGLLLAMCGIWVSLRRIDLVVARVVRPHRVHAGNPCTVEIQIRNRNDRSTPILRLHDPVSGTAGADLLLAPLEAGRTSTVAYRLPTSRRGLVSVGPLTVEISDPFGLTTSKLVAAPSVELTVLPRVDDVKPLPRTVGPDPDGGAERRSSIGRSGEDFVALRPYHPGDDLRKVHWPSSARTDDDLLVRQDDVPWQGRVCVLLDNRREVHDADTIERAVSATASIVRTHIRRGDHVRLLLSDGTDFGERPGSSHLDLILEHLAVVDRTSHGSLRGALDVVGRGGAGSLVLVTGKPPKSDLEALERVGPAFAVRRVVRLDIETRTTMGRRTAVLGVAPGGSFPETWNRAAATIGRRGARLRR